MICCTSNLIQSLQLRRTMEEPMNGDGWIEHTSFVEDTSPVTCLEYDHYYDLMWSAQANGRLSSYGFSDDLQYFDSSSPEPQYYANAPDMSRLSSVSVAPDAIVQLLPNHASIVAVSCSKIRMLSYNSTGINSWSLNNCPSQTMVAGTFPMLSSAEAAFTCADLVRDPTLPRFSSTFMAASLVAGTSTNAAYLFDLTQGIDSPVMVYNVAQPTVKIQSNGHIIVAAGQDGNLRLLDGKFRTRDVTKLIEAHSGSITDVCLHGDGRTLITCGTSKRSINPYDPKSPFHYAADLQVRVFDLRMHRMVQPLPVTAPAASVTGLCAVRLIPQVDTLPVEYSSLLMCTSDGVVQVNSLTADPSDPSAVQALYPPLSNTSEILTTAAVASSGQYLAVGTSSGAVGQYVKASAAATNAWLHSGAEGMKSTALYRVNEVSPNPRQSPARETPPAPPRLSFGVESSVLGTSYVLNAPHHTPEMLSSSFAMTPAVLKRKMRLVPTARISAELLGKSVARQDFIRIIPNPGFRPNSMKNVPKAAPSVSTVNGERLNPPYAVCDPRKLQLLQQQLGQAGAVSGGMVAAGALAGAGIVRPSSRQGSLDDASDAVSLSGAESGASPSAIPPKHYLRHSSLLIGSKQRFKKFDYSTVNDTPFVGLENNVPNSFINPLLQLLYSLPAVRDQALVSQTSPYHHHEAGQGSIMCELGFLFHMMRQVAEYVVDRATEGIDKVVKAANFQRVFQTLRLMPEAVALSLFDENLQADLQQFVQVLTPFLLRLLVKEADQEATWAASGTTAGTGASSGSSRGKGGKWSANNSAPAAAARATSGATSSSDAATAVVAPSVIDDTFGFSTLSSTTFLLSGVHKVDPKHNRALMLDLIYPSLSNPSGSSRRPAPGGKAVTASVSPTPSSANLTGEESGAPGNATASAFAYKVTGKKGRPNMSFAAVLWGSFQREVSMKGWCAETDSYEPFKKAQSLVSLPRVLGLHCGNTQADVKDSTTLAGALGETVGQGTTHANYWNHPVLITVENKCGTAADAASVDPLLRLADGGCKEFHWLPLELEVAFLADVDSTRPEEAAARTAGGTVSGNRTGVSAATRLVVSCRVVPSVTEGGPDDSLTQPVWITFDGSRESVESIPASEQPSYAAIFSGPDWTVRRFDLLSLVLQVNPPPAPQVPAHLSVLAAANSANEKKHLVLQINKSATFDPSGWHLFNDFIVQSIPLSEVVTFPQWKHPCMVYFHQRHGPEEPPLDSPPPTWEKLAVPASVLQLESLSRTPSIRLLQSFATLPGPGDIIAFDGEFVSVSLEKSMINAAGERVVSEEVRQVLARMSLLDVGHGPKDAEGGGQQGPGSPGSTAATGATGEGPGSTVFNKNMMRIIADDYILPVEPVLDYVTRFSGITEEDLNQATSKHSLLTQRSAYLKLRYFIDAKCVFVGHGLQKDFETANIFVPPEQIRDTVELWRLPNQRKISLRFLASYILKEDIQDEIHDSIEDAKTSLLLYRKYKALAAEGTERVSAVLQDLYAYGHRSNWTIGLEKLTAVS